MNLNLFVSQKCLISCKGCYSFSRTEKCNQMVPTNKIIDFLEYAYNKGQRKVTLCGGDPLTRQDIMNLLRKIKSIGYTISLDTLGTPIIKNIEKNGRILIKKIEAYELVKVVDYIGIPIDGSTNDVFKLFRQTNSDIVNDQIKICDELHKYDANICVNTVIHKGNLNDSINLSNLVQKLNYIKKWQLFQYAPLGKYGILNKDLFEITEEEFLSFKSNVLKSFNNNFTKIQFKDFSARNKAYILIDNSGDAWIPTFDSKVFNDNNEIEKRKIIGNIKNPDDWDKICSYLKDTKLNGNIITY